MTVGSYTIGNMSTPYGSPTYASRSWSGADTPKGGVKSWHPYTMTSIRARRELCLVGTSWSPGSWTWDQSYQYDTTLDYPWTYLFSSNDQLDLLNKLSEKIRGHSFNAAVFGAEFKQSLDTVSDSAKRVLGMLYYASRGQFAKASRQLGAGKIRKLRTSDVSDFVLSLRYGWQPLIQDAYGAMKAIEATTAGPRSIKFQASKRIPWKADTSTSVPVYRVDSEGYFSRRLYAWVSEPPSIARSLGLLNPAAVLWERLPWSFVADWFIPIGSYLDAISFMPSLEATYATVDFARARGKLATRQPNTINYQYIGGNVEYEAVRVARSAKGAISVPMPSFKDLDKAFSLTHIQNAAALVWSGINNHPSRSSR